MNIQRFLWAATVLLLGLIGGILGHYLGAYYAGVLHRLDYATPSTGLVLPNTLAAALCIVAARFGSFIANNWLLHGIRQLGQVSAADRVLGITGSLMGLIFGVLITLQFPNDPMWIVIKFCVMLVGAAVGMAIFGGMRSEMLRVLPQLEDTPQTLAAGGTRPKFLDTNIIIDGRLADICKTGFIDGPIYVPSFVLDEVQHIADSSDGLRRARGRRGLDVLNAMKELTMTQTANGTTVRVPLVHVLSEFPSVVQKIHAVDSKLVALAKEHDGVLITNDFNLNKVAELQGVPVLNLNELAGAIKPVVLPGEEMQITIVKEGKELGQGVGYLDDGTMVVIGEGAAHIGETLGVTISSVYQTVAGKMIFAELREKENREPAKPQQKGAGDDLFEESAGNGNGNGGRKDERGGRYNDDYGSRSGGGMRRKSRA